MKIQLLVTTYETEEVKYINDYTFNVNDSEELKSFIYDYENKQVSCTSFIYNKLNDTVENIADVNHLFTYLPKGYWLDYKPQIIEEEATEINYLTFCHHVFKAMTYKCQSFKEYEDADFSLILIGAEFEYEKDDNILYDDNDELVSEAVEEYEMIYNMRRDTDNLTYELENMEDKLSDIFEDNVHIYPFCYQLENTLNDIQEVRIVTKTLYNELDRILRYHYYYEV